MPQAINIGKFGVLATYTYAKALADEVDDDSARQQGLVAAIMGRVLDRRA